MTSSSACHQDATHTSVMFVERQSLSLRCREIFKLPQLPTLSSVSCSKRFPTKVYHLSCVLVRQTIRPASFLLFRINVFCVLQASITDSICWTISPFQIISYHQADVVCWNQV